MSFSKGTSNRPSFRSLPIHVPAASTSPSSAPVVHTEEAASMPSIEQSDYVSTPQSQEQPSQAEVNEQVSMSQSSPEEVYEEEVFVVDPLTRTEQELHLSS
ncbi:hypothetical protein V6N13_026532 [Hibiscus sabdariffa]|uniref:Uncharacterized protein n=2 Tax=Hibiscus sabdariffa TaxID=183260 RepID=A0ABR1ZYW5_9ROSI